MKRHIYLEDLTGAHWPGVLPWRHANSRKGYATIEDAEDRARHIRHHYAAKHGSFGPDLVVRTR